MKIFITGGAGTLGANLCRHFMSKDMEVAVCDNFSTGIKARVSLFPALKVFEGSICDENFVFNTLKDFKPDLIIHSAGSYADPNNWSADIDTNISGTINLIKACESLGIEKIINFQTVLCYAQAGKTRLSENQPLDPKTSYAISKVAAEQYLLNSNIDAMSLRISNVVSPFLSIGPIPTFYKRIANRQNCFCTDAVRDFLSQEDFLEIIDRILSSPIRKGVLNVGSGEGHSITDVYREVAKHFGLDPGNVEVRPCGDDDVKHVVLDITAASQNYDWKPSIGFKETIKNQLEWYDEHGIGEIYSHLKTEVAE